MCLCIRGPGLIPDHADERHQMWKKIKVSERQPGPHKLSTGDGGSSVPEHLVVQELGQCHLQTLIQEGKGSLPACWGLVPRGYSGEGPLLSILSHLSCLVWYSARSTEHLWWPTCHHLDVLTLNFLQYQVPRWHVWMWNLSNSFPWKKASRYCWTFSSVPPLPCYLRC